MRAVLIVLGFVLVGGTVLYYTSEGRQERLQYDEARARWHQDCDAYVDKPVRSDEARDCANRLKAMMAYAERKGW
jgi:hypothetical protein